MTKTLTLDQTPVEVEVVKSGPYFWHRNFVGKKLPVKNILMTECGLYFHVDTGFDRPKGAMEGIPWGVAEAFCIITRTENKETIINEERTGL